MHLSGDAFLTTRALPPHPLERLGKRLAAKALCLLPRDEFVDGGVRLLPPLAS